MMPTLSDQKLPRFDLKAGCNALEIVDRKIALASLNAADVRSVHIDLQRERLLTESLLGSQLPNIRGDNAPKDAWMIPLHFSQSADRCI